MRLCPPINTFMPLLVLLICLRQPPVTNSMFEKIHVHIVNAFQNETLQARCQSKDDDLGVQRIPATEEFRWHFRIAMFKTTLFFCDARWSGGHKSFDAFIENEWFMKNCIKQCIWKINEGGISLYSFKYKQDIPMYSWES